MTDKERVEFWEKQFKWLEEQYKDAIFKLYYYQQQLESIKKIVNQ